MPMPGSISWLRAVLGAGSHRPVAWVGPMREESGLRESELRGWVVMGWKVGLDECWGV